MEQQAAQEIGRDFLRTRSRSGHSDTALASACEQAVQHEARRSFKAGLRLAERFLTAAQDGGGPLLSTALRCKARMLHLSGRHGDALPLYLQARRMLQREPVVRSRIDKILIDVYMYVGDFKKSHLAARRALRVFGTPGHESDLAQTRVNYGNLLHRQDRHREAERLYHEAATYFETTDNKVALARCYYNRANTLVQLFDTTTAEALYQQAREIYDDAGFELDSLDCRYGLAWLWMLTGKYHRALIELDYCHRQYRSAGDPRGEALCELDRAEVYLSLGMYDDALSSARAAEHKFGQLNLRYEASKAALFLGQAAMAIGHHAEANRAMQRAREGFRRENNAGFSGAVHLLAADLAPDDASRTRQLAAARDKFRHSQLPYWETICDFREATAGRHRTAALKRLSHQPAAKEVPHMYALWQTLKGDDEYRKGRHRSAIESWQRAADRLDLVRAQLPPLELRSAYTRKQASPYTRLVSASLDRDPLWAAVWSERNKTAGLWAPIRWDRTESEQRHRIRESLSELARQVALTAHRISSSTDGKSTRQGDHNKFRRQLLRRIRQQMLELESDGSGTLDRIEELADAFRETSSRMPIVQFHIHGDDIIAFLHVDRQTRTVRWSDGRSRLRRTLREWRLYLEQQLTSQVRGNGADGDDRDLWSDLGEWLWKPLRIGSDHTTVLVIPEGEIANLPWPAVIDNGQSLLDRHSFILSPSLRHYLGARRSATRSDRIEIFHGHDHGIECVMDETSYLKDRASGRATVHSPACRDSWPLAGDAEVWHYAGHAVLRRDNPFYSYLELDDGPLFAADFCLRDCHVNLVTLAACRAGEQVAMPGDEATGLVRSLLEMGARNVVAGYWPVADASTAVWMKTFFDGYLINRQVKDSARIAAQSVREAFPQTYHWAAFATYGAGDSGGSYEIPVS